MLNGGNGENGDTMGYPGMLVVKMEADMNNFSL